jgi:GNAT superfamily N-acetyltransferase
MTVEIREVGAAGLPTYAEIPIRFTVTSILRVEEIEGSLGGLRLVEQPVDPPYVKDYDAQGDERERPIHWATRFEVNKWGFFLAVEGDRAVGGATVAFDAPGVNMLEARSDLAVLWDIRVCPEERGRGIGSLLFQHAAAWARARGCRQLKVETQNVNLRACRFYARQGCELGAIHRHGYVGCPEVAHEVMLLWYLALS